MSAILARPELFRARPAYTFHAFASGITASGLGGVPHDCLCTWVWRHGVYTLKFTNRCCPVPAHRA